MFCCVVLIVSLLILYVEVEVFRVSGRVDKDRKTDAGAEQTTPSRIMERIIVIPGAILLQRPKLTLVFPIDCVFVNGSFLSFP